MKKILNLLIFATALGLIGCRDDAKTGSKFTCGTTLASDELTPFEVITKPAYPPLELKLLGKLSMAIFDANNRVKSYNVQFFENTRERLVVQVYGIWDPAEMDRAACAVFNFKDYMLPAETLVIFYQNEKSAPKMQVVAGVRKK
jgi:hypothetical protein